MNNNDRKKHSKTLAIAGMGFLLIAAAFTFSFANSGQQLVNAQQNQTQGGGGGGNATQTIVAVPFDTFTGSGVITATVSEAGGQAGGGNQTSGGGNQTSGGGNQTSGGGNQTSGAASAGGGGAEEYIIGGNWNMEVQAGNMTNFGANFIMVHPDGTEYHTHNITNFVTPTAGVQLVQGQEATITGTADIYTNGTNRWPGTDTTLTLTQNGAVMTIMPAAEDTDNHFQGQPIYGIVSALTGENGTSIVQTTPPGQAQQQQEEGGDEGPLGGLLPGGEDQQQEGGNQTGGGPLGEIGEQIGELFGGGGGGGQGQ